MRVRTFALAGAKAALVLIGACLASSRADSSVPCAAGVGEQASLPKRPTSNLTSLCEQATNAFTNITAPQKPTTAPTTTTDGLLSNAPVSDPCSSLFELLYEKGLYTAAHVYRIGLGRSGTMLFDPFTSITLLAPSDTAFAAVNITEDSAPDPTWRSLAESHLLPGAITSRDVACSKKGGSYTLDAESWASHVLTLHIDGKSKLSTISRSGHASVSVVNADIPGCYSVLHVIDRVMLA